MSGWAGGRRQLTAPLSAGSGIGRQSPAAVAQAAVAVVLLCCGAVAVALPDAGNCAPDNYGVWRPR